jgi:hypothetical protein
MSQRDVSSDRSPTLVLIPLHPLFDAMPQGPPKRLQGDGGRDNQGRRPQLKHRVSVPGWPGGHGASDLILISI